MRIPYGFSVTDCGEFVVEESAANHIKQIFSCYLAGASLGKIADFLYAKQILSPTGNPKWTRAAIDKILSNSKYTLIVGLDIFVAVQYEKAKRCNVDHEKAGKPRKATRYVSPELICV